MKRSMEEVKARHVEAMLFIRHQSVGTQVRREATSREETDLRVLGRPSLVSLSHVKLQKKEAKQVETRVTRDDRVE